MPILASFADDAAGIVGVQVVSNETVSIVLPFDALGQSPIVSGLLPGEEPEVEAGFGDTLVFIPSDADGRDFYISGRIPGLASTNNFPRVESVFVSPSAGFAQFEIATDGKATDVLAQESTNGIPRSFPWTHYDRLVGQQTLQSWSDLLPVPGSGRLYIFSDATLDSDGDGISDSLETRVFGTSPNCADTDGDGLPDLWEIDNGLDPLSGSWNIAPLFEERFELPLVAEGSLDGQNGWSVAGVGTAVVHE